MKPKGKSKRFQKMERKMSKTRKTLKDRNKKHFRYIPFVTKKGRKNHE